MAFSYWAIWQAVSAFLRSFLYECGILDKSRIEEIVSGNCRMYCLESLIKMDKTLQSPSNAEATFILYTRWQNILKTT